MPSLSDDEHAADLPVTSAGGLAGYDPLQQHMLVRNARLGKLQCEVLPQLDPSDYRIMLIHRALYSTYRDLQTSGLASEARLLRERMLAEPRSGQAA